MMPEHKKSTKIHGYQADRMAAARRKEPQKGILGSACDFFVFIRRWIMPGFRRQNSRRVSTPLDLRRLAAQEGQQVIDM